MCRIFFIVLSAFFILTSSIEAAKVDIYRNALINKNFTLKYEITKVPVYSSMREGNLTFEGALQNKVAKKLSDALHGGIIVVNGEDRYIETHNEAFEMESADFSNLSIAACSDIKYDAKNKKHKFKVPESGVCNLFKGGDVFEFIWTKNGDKKKYKGMVPKEMFGYRYFDYKSGEIQANVYNLRTPYQDLIEEFNYGVPEVALILMPLLPREKIIATAWTPEYKFFGSGSLAGGLTYEDFVSDKNNFYSAIRYYFSGENMIKVAVASYIKNNGKIQSYEKRIIDITEFAPSADLNYLKIPEGLKDTTKRAKDGGKK